MTDPQEIVEARKLINEHSNINTGSCGCQECDLAVEQFKFYQLGLRTAAEIVLKYEPSQKADHITYASKEILALAEGEKP